MNFLMNVDSDKPAQPDFKNALQTQKVCEALGRKVTSTNITKVA